VPKSHYSALFSEAEKICIPDDLKAKRRGSRATHLPAAMSGSEEFVKNQKSNAQNADIDAFYRLPTM
jgi:hypothetical protein